jgi:hypothetical protein
MTSKEQAKIVGDTLLAAAEAERQRVAEQKTRSLVRFYPELQRVPPLERYARLGAAREFAAGYISSQMFMTLLLLTLAALIALLISGHVQLAVSAGFLAMLLGIARQIIELVLMRRYLRQSVGKNDP